MIMYCKNCGCQLPEGVSYCPNCGAPVTDKSANQPKETDPNYLNGQDKLTMALICFFLGGLGIHNFMLGETKKGIIKVALLCCCGIGYILAIYDFIKILTDSYVVEPDKFI